MKESQPIPLSNSSPDPNPDTRDSSKTNRANNPSPNPARLLPETPNQKNNVSQPIIEKKPKQGRRSNTEKNKSDNFLVRATNEDIINLIINLITNLTKEKSEEDLHLLIRSLVDLIYSCLSYSSFNGMHRE